MRHVKSLKSYKAYLIDLDGTMYRGNEPIDSAVRFVQKLATKNIPYLFVTNNSSQTPEVVVSKLMKMNVPVTTDQVMTSSLATAEYIRDQNETAKCFVIGETGLYTALENAGLKIQDDDVQYVVMGIDWEINYEKLAKASLLVRAGAKLISTNSDLAVPTEQGLVPGNGALTGVVAASTGVDPVYIGKPESIIMDLSLRKLGLEKDEVIMVGDNYQTDILAGIQNRIDTLMVFTGVTPIDEYDQLSVKPTYHVTDLAGWLKNI